MSDSSPIDLARHPQAVRVRKLPLPVEVRWMARDGVCQTLEGEVAYRAGDVVLTGIDGESWPVAADRFAAGYEPVPPTQPGADGAYRKRQVTLLALQLQQALTVRVGYQHDPLQGKAGDWLVQYGPDDFGIVAATIFPRTYELAPPEVS